MIRYLLLILALSAAGSADAATLNRWIQFAPDTAILARAITDSDTCPSLSVDGTSLTMHPRNPVSATFPVQECEAAIPPGHRDAMIDGVALHLPVATPRRIVVVGDTGCRIQGSALQACNDPAQFPLARLSQLVAAMQPDLIIHVGDYYYRETACPAGNTGCAGSPYLDKWPAWNADWFTPAAAMMAAAPLALTRGNHESCGRGARGWFTLLDPRPYDEAAAACTRGSTYDSTAPYTIQVGPTTLLMFDSSYANDMKIDQPVTSLYRSQLEAALPALTGPTIFVTHRPTYGLFATTGSGAAALVSGGNSTEQALFAGGVPQPIGLLLSGHIHNFQALQTGDPNYAPQLVVGNSGTLLDPDLVPGNMQGSSFATAPGAQLPIVSTTDEAEFGFVVLDILPDSTHADLYTLDGTPHGACVIRVNQRYLVCSQ
jgi:hypothetical protein